MKRWKQQRLQNQAIQIGQALYQHNVDEVNIDPEIDDIIDINSININNTIDDPIISNVNVSKSRFLNDAIDKIKQLSCDESNIITEKDISCALVLLKKRHCLSARCMDDIISLLRTFNVPNVPSSWSVARFKQTIADRDEPFFRPLVEELVTLEQSAKFQYQDDNNSSTSARIFLIGACCDKPTQALLQFLPEPIATFGCKRCEVEGRKRLLQLWFDPDYRFQDWSISTHLSELQLIFRGLGLPSMTPRLPCCLISYSKFKANEMRILLLFGHAIFKNILKKDYTFLETRRDDAPV
ncbi:unnamed protein product [Rotaria socialis]